MQCWPAPLHRRTPALRCTQVAEHGGILVPVYTPVDAYEDTFCATRRFRRPAHMITHVRPEREPVRQTSSKYVVVSKW